jgi:murein DD-endopeptidase MepM/ murein hydrolase activator NlpD
MSGHERAKRLACCGLPLLAGALVFVGPGGGSPSSGSPPPGAKGFVAPTGAGPAPSATSSSAGASSASPAPPSAGVATDNPGARPHAVHVAEGASCGRRLGAPFDGHLVLRSAYRGAKPGVFQFCPQWSAFGNVRGVRNHGGIDISAPTGTPVRAATDGTLTYGRDPGGYGLFARVKFSTPVRGRDGSCGKPEEHEILYAHLLDDTPRVHFGPRPVRAGEIVGRVGCTGNAKGMCSPSPESHLHVTVERPRKRRARVDPPSFLGWNVGMPRESERPSEWGSCYRASHRARSGGAMALVPRK